MDYASRATSWHRSPNLGFAAELAKCIPIFAFESWRDGKSRMPSSGRIGRRIGLKLER